MLAYAGVCWRMLAYVVGGDVAGLLLLLLT
jgi:hypothetical protein